MAGGSNGPFIINGGASDYDRTLCPGAPVAVGTGEFVDPRAQLRSDLRRRLLVRLGYSAQVSPPGMDDLLNDFLQSANVELYERYRVLHRFLWFGWQTQVGQRFYDIPINCTKYMDPRHVREAWLQDDETWVPLISGINPATFNMTENSRPIWYEIRESIEVWPAPDAATYVLWFKADYGPNAFSSDTDYPAVDSQAVFLHALARAKRHYSQPDAGNYDRDLEILLGNYTAGSHNTRKYVPGERPLPPMTRPIRQ